MFIEKREYGDFIITEHKNDKGQDIVIKLNSEIRNEIAYVTGNYSKIINLSWELKGEDISNLYMQINTELIDKELSLTVKLDSEKLIKELVNIVKHNGTIEDCSELNRAFYLSYNKLFKECLKDRIILMSDYIMEGIVKIKESNKTLGHGGRFVLSNNRVIVCEYTGKEITRDTLPKLEIYVEGYKIKYTCINTINDSDSRVIFSNNNDIGYLKFAGMVSSLEEVEKETQNYPKLDVPYFFSNERDMIRECMQRNNLDDIIKYKIAFKGKVEIIDVNKYMVNEFLI